jgi:GTP-binding protein Era
MNKIKNPNEKKLYVSVIGRTNSGKSTLINHIMNRKITAVSSRPHTTTRVIKGIYTEGSCQIVFLDTPGITYVNGSTRNNEIAKASINKDDDNHLNIFVFPANRYLEDRMISFSKFIPANKKIALITKIDTIQKPKLLPMTKRLNELGFDNILYFSIKDPICLEDLKTFLLQNAKEGEWDYDAELKTDNTIKGLVTEATKEVLFNKLYEEIPYQIKIKNETIDTNDKGEYIIHQQLILKKNAHHIILGRIKEISIEIAKNIQEYLHTKKKIHFFLKIVDKE